MSPNPLNPTAVITYEARTAGPVALEIHDVAGRHLLTERLGSVPPGLHRTIWHGRDDRGRRVSSGVYLVRVRGADGVSAAAKAVVIR